MAEGEKLAEQFKFLMEWFNGLSEFERCDILYREYYGRSMYLAQLQMQA